MKASGLIFFMILFCAVNIGSAQSNASPTEWQSTRVYSEGNDPVPVAPRPGPTSENYSDTTPGAYGNYIRTGRMGPPPAPPSPNFDQLSNDLATYQGRPLDDAIDQFGPPEAQQVIAGHKMYIWAVRNMEEIPVRSIASTEGTLNGQSFSATTYGGGGTTSRTAHCKVTMEVDDQLVVERVWFDGNMVGCRRFMKVAPAG